MSDTVKPLFSLGGFQFEVLSTFESFEAPAPSSPLKAFILPSKPRSLGSRLDSVLECLDVQRTPEAMVVLYAKRLLDGLASPVFRYVCLHFACAANASDSVESEPYSDPK